MRIQLFLLAIATIVSIAVGAGKWRARMTAASDFARDERRGRWVFVVPDTMASGVATWSRSGGRQPIARYRSVYVADGGLAARRDLARIAYVDNQKWDAPAIAVRAVSISEKPIASVASPQGHQLACPRFDADGSVLYLDTSAWQPSTSYSSGRPGTTLERIPLPEEDVVMASATARTVRLAAPIANDDCFELSSDGAVLAWVGTDHQIHVAKRSGDDYLLDHKTFSGVDAEISPDGTWLAVVDGVKLVKVDIASGSRNTIADMKPGFGLGAISPDGTWIVVQEGGSFSGYGWTALRVKDGAPVGLPLPDRRGSYTPDRDRLWIAREGELPDPTPMPTRTPRPRTTPRRR